MAIYALWPYVVDMKIVIALDSFKGSLDAATASLIVADAVREVCPGATTERKPMADGGEGTARAMLSAMPGEWMEVTAAGPREGMRVKAGYAWLSGRQEAVVEMAAASGLVLLEPARRDPLVTTTRGTGELLRAAAEGGAKRIYLAVGGSATVDGGTGAARALGWRFLDAGGNDLPEGGGGLAKLREVIPPEKLDLPPVTVLCDVDNPLLGPRGAAAVYGPQKGATPAGVALLERGLARLAAAVQSTTGRAIANLSGGGAAGGLAAGAVAFMDAALTSGAEAVMQTIGLDEELAEADWVITGEGRFDDQSLQGKVVSGVTRLARARGVPVAVLAGSVQLPPAAWAEAGIAAALAITPEGMPLENAMEKAPELLAAAARTWAREHLC